MSATIVSIMEWWLEIFGISDPAYVKLGLTLVGSALLLMALYVAALLLIGVFTAIVELGSGK